MKQLLATGIPQCLNKILDTPLMKTPLIESNKLKENTSTNQPLVGWLRHELPWLWCGIALVYHRNWKVMEWKEGSEIVGLAVRQLRLVHSLSDQITFNAHQMLSECSWKGGKFLWQTSLLTWVTPELRRVICRERLIIVHIFDPSEYYPKSRHRILSTR